MKKHMAILSAAVNNAALPLLIIMILTSALQTVLFCIGMGQDAAQMRMLDRVIDSCGVPVAGWIGYLALCVVLCRMGCEYGGTKLNNLLQRLRISQRVVTLEWAAFNALCFLVFWGMQAGLLTLLGRMYVLKAVPGTANEQSIFLGAYFSDYFHNMLPLDDLYRLIRNFVFVLTLGLATALFGFKQRKGAKPIMAVVFCISLPFVFLLGLDTVDADMVFTAIGVPSMILSAAAALWGGGDENA